MTKTHDGSPDLGSLLRGWQEVQGYTDTEAAKACGLSQPHWYMLRSGKRLNVQVATLKALAGGTGIPILRLMDAAVQAVAAAASSKPESDV